MRFGDNLCSYFYYVLARTSCWISCRRMCTAHYLSTFQPRLQLPRPKTLLCPSLISGAKECLVLHWGRKWYSLFIMLYVGMTYISVKWVTKMLAVVKICCPFTTSTILFWDASVKRVHPNKKQCIKYIVVLSIFHLIPSILILYLIRWYLWMMWTCQPGRFMVLSPLWSCCASG